MLDAAGRTGRERVLDANADHGPNGARPYAVVSYGLRATVRVLSGFHPDQSFGCLERPNLKSLGHIGVTISPRMTKMLHHFRSKVRRAQLPRTRETWIDDYDGSLPYRRASTV